MNRRTTRGRSGIRCVATQLSISVVLVGALALLAGCGLGPGEERSGDVQIRVTDNFGTKKIALKNVSDIHKDETVMRLTQRSFDVETRFGGGFVQSINGREGTTAAGSDVDWFYFVNGIQAPKGADDTEVTPNDQIWWDRRNSEAAPNVTGVVGAFPEPFRSGLDGKRFPVRLDCTSEGQQQCKQISNALGKYSVAPAYSSVGAEPGKETLRIVIGTWQEVAGDDAVRLLINGPQRSGVYAMPADEGKSTELLGVDGKLVKKVGAGSGLIAVTRSEGAGQQTPTWVVTGPDRAGVKAAVASFTKQDLDSHYAVAIDGGKVIPLPVQDAK